MLNGDGDWETGEILMGFELISCLDQSHEIVEKDAAPVCLLNPITRESMWLPKSQLILNQCYSIGFGFGRLNNKYKGFHGVRAFSEIITVGESSWRKLEFPVPFCNIYGRFNSRSNPVFLDGTLYWLICTPPFYVEKYINLP
ncbi:hypothetical protein NE237_031762 [Protea cynaroides]|uniref:F-box protein n=1 Tax=Protea cynaroides TaxID=273540 RepID=A0A9Q0R2W6_9MAGN|nr:hypothetical protein NE237_031762 [Protea cynaroides]